jgi:hypothetical protein
MLGIKYACSMKKMMTIKNRKLETSCDKLFRKKLEQEKEN